LPGQKEENKENLNINEIANKWQKEMSKGFTKVITLALLSIKKMHGYQLVELIKERTSHFLNPSTSTIYPILSSLENNGFITCNVEKKGGRERKIYSITTKGQKLLDELINRQQNVLKAMHSLFSKLKDNIFSADVISRISNELPILDIKKLKNEKPKDKVISELEIIKKVLSNRINKLNEKLIEIDKEINSLKLL